MGEKYYQESMWIRDESRAGYMYRAGGYYDTTEPINELDYKFVSYRELRELIPLLEKDGVVKAKFTNEARGEDLKITHRLLDILEKRGG